MAQEPVNLVSPVGRIVWGSTTERATHDYDNKPYEDGKGPFQFGHAVRKDAPGVDEFMQALFQAAINGYPGNQNMVQRITNEWQSGFAGLNFRFKIKDGDKPNQQGVVNENTKGCWVFAYSTTLPIKATHYGLQFTDSMGNPIGNNQEIEPKHIERGYYVDVAVAARVNEKLDGTAGLYLNPNCVRLIAYGEKIVGGMSTEQAFANAGAPAYIPPGASTTGPVAGAPVAVPAAGQPAMPGAVPTDGAPAAAATAPVMPAAPAGQAPSPTAAPSNIQPHNNFLPGAVGMPGTPGQ